MSEPLPPGSEGVTSRVVFPCDLAAARASTRALRDFLAAQGMDENELFSCELCLVEACNNAVQYADVDAKKHPIRAEVTCDPERVEMRVIDHTSGFSWPGPLSPPTPERERGRGLFIIQSLMTDVAYYRGSGENLLVMRKRRSTPPTERAPSKTAAASDATRAQLADCVRTINGMVRELCFRSESLSAIFRCAAELGRTSDLEAFARRLLDDLLHLTAADWFVLRLLAPGDSRLVAFAATLPEIQGHEILVPAETPADCGAEIAAIHTRAPLPFDLRDRALANEPLVRTGPQSTGVVQPLLFGETLVGTLAVGRRGDHPVFTGLEAEVVRTFSEFLAIQIVNLRHREEQVQNRLVSHELEIARNIQRALMPAVLPQPAGFSLAGSWECARKVGGDYYDALVLNDHSMLLVVCDVMGKGVPAAMFAAIVRSLIHGLAGHCNRPAELLARLNKLMYKDLSAVNMFITAQLIFVDHKKRRVIASSAGHCPALLLSSDTGGVEILHTAGTPLGVLPDAQYTETTGVMQSPCGLVIYTDGLIEARNPAGEMFGTDRLTRWLGAHCNLPCDAEGIRDRLAEELRRFRGEAPMGDDQAFLVMTETRQPVTLQSPSRRRGATFSPPGIPVTAGLLGAAKGRAALSPSALFRGLNLHP